MHDFIARHDRIYVVEQNRDGQMADLIRLAVGEDQRKIRKILHYIGLPCDARSISNAVLEMEADQTIIKKSIGVVASGSTRASED
jgi:2-oxoglutarate ferredoxin oxidoreductase subunit alpha